MSKIVRLFAIVTFLAVPAFAATHAERIDALISAYNKLRQFNGSALVAEKGSVILEKGYGLANIEWQIPNTPDTKFRIGSITKQFTSMVIMQLVSEGKIKLDEKITTYLPDYRRDTGDKVTVRHLLTHTSGIPSYTSIPGFFQNQSRDPYAVGDFVKKYTMGDLEFEPGSKFSYDNSGYFLLGAILERVTGKSYEKNLQERIFGPLGMKDSGYDRSNTVLSHRASGYVLTPAGYENAPYLDMTIPFAAGSLYSTVADLYTWDRALYADKLLAPELKKAVFTPNLSEYAFGWAVHKLKLDNNSEVDTISHDGGINGFNSTIVRFPGMQDLIVLLDNTSRGDRIDDLARGIADILHDVEAPQPRISLIDELMKTLSSGNGKQAVARYRELKAKAPAQYDFREPELNRLGYLLLQQGRVTDAIDIFALNVDEYPATWNVYDSLGEAYAAHGDRDLAIKNYKKSIELNPKNTNGVDALKRLEQPAAAVDAATLEKYVGNYALAPGFNLAITRDGSTLFAQATGQSRVELAADSPTEFHILAVKASITFAPDGSALTLHQGGRDVPAKRQ
ncbi:MAG: serine hydrolase [Acidobacteriota bacterium]|nr:serine hydrolase [Acidobacteriota bacterium]